MPRTLIRRIIRLLMKKKKFQLSLIVTNRCNLNCVYCYENSKSTSLLNPDLCKEIISQYLNSKEYDEIEIDFFGGEPFLEFYTIRSVCEWVWSKRWRNKYIFFATTNGVFVKNEIKEWLRDHKKLFWVSLSLDGTRDSHNINRSNSFDKIDLSFFKECWPTQTVKMTISKETVDKIYENIVYIHSLGFDITGTNFAEGIDWEDDKYINIVSSQLEKLCEFYINNPNIKPVPLVSMPIHKCAAEKVRTKWCGCGEHMAAYETDGKKYPCTFFTPMTFDAKILKNICDEIDFECHSQFIGEDCFRNCYLEPVCTSCYGANLLSTGAVNKRDRSKCALMKVRAVFSAALRAHQILQNPVDIPENRLAITAIKRINDLFNVGINI